MIIIETNILLLTPRPEGGGAKRLPQVFVSPRQCTDHWQRFEGGRQALVKSAPTAIPFDTPVTGMVRPGGKRLNVSCPQSPRAHQWSFRFLLPSLWWPLSRGLPRDVHPSGNFLRISKTATIPWILIKNTVGSSYLRGTVSQEALEAGYWWYLHHRPS